MSTSEGKTESPRRFAIPRLGHFAFAGSCVAIIGSSMVGICECTLAVLYGAGGVTGARVPAELVIACVGMACVTHLLVWWPVMLLCALALAVAVHRKASPKPEGLLCAVFAAVSGFVVVPADLELVHADSGLNKSVGVCGVGLAAVVAYIAVRKLHSTLGPVPFRRLGLTATCVCAGAVLGSGLFFVRSPLFDPARYRIPSGVRIATTHNRPHVLWIVLDTVRADRMSCHGYAAPTTPNLDQLSKTSVVFDHAIADGTWTVPAHASMFTGLSVREHGADHGHLRLDDRFKTVAESLLANGYATTCFSNNPFISRDTNLMKGFDTYYPMWHLRHFAWFSLTYLCEKWGITSFVPWLDPDFGAALTNYSVDHWLDGRDHTDGPLFVFVNYMEGHLPYRIPRSYRELFMTDEEAGRSYDLRFQAHGNIINALDLRFNIEGPGFLAASDRQILESQYHAAIRYLDDRTHELIEMFRHRGLLDNTLLVITSDHGEYLDTHGLWAHRFLAYQDLAHVALLLREPGRGQTPRRVSAAVQLSDLHATVLRTALGNDPALAELRGHDLLADADKDDQTRVVITEYNGPSAQTQAHIRQRGTPSALRLATPQIAAQDGRYKYIQSRDGRQELYDLSVDPHEGRNLIDEQPDIAGRLREHIVEWLARVPPHPGSDAGTEPTASEAVLRALRSLGYVEQEDE